MPAAPDTPGTLAGRLRRQAIRYLKYRGRTRTEAYLAGLGVRSFWAFIHINKCGGTSVEQALEIPKIHDTARQRRDRIGAERWARLTTFSIVRHPYDRAASLYRYRVKTGQTGLDTAPLSFDDWVRAAFRDADPAYRDRPLMFAPARDWLADEDGRIMVDFVGRLERIEFEIVAGGMQPIAQPRQQHLVG